MLNAFHPHLNSHTLLITTVSSFPSGVFPGDSLDQALICTWGNNWCMLNRSLTVGWSACLDLIFPVKPLARIRTIARTVQMKFSRNVSASGNHWELEWLVRPARILPQLLHGTLTLEQFCVRLDTTTPCFAACLIFALSLRFSSKTFCSLHYIISQISLSFVYSSQVLGSMPAFLDSLLQCLYTAYGAYQLVSCQHLAHQTGPE